MRYARIITVLLVLFFLPGCAAPQTSQDMDTLSYLLDDFSEAIANGIPADMELTIYYRTPYVSFDMPIDETELIIMCSESEDASIAGKVLIDSTQLLSQLDQFKKITSAALRKPIISQYKNAWIYYYIETEAAGKVLEVTISGIHGNIFVNGTELKYNPVFLDLVSPYLPQWQIPSKDS